MAPPDSLETTLERLSQRQRIKPINSHHLHIRRIPGQIKPHHDHQVRQHENTPLEIIALPLAIHITQQKNTKNHSHHIPLREDQIESMIHQIRRVDIPAMDGAEKDKRWDLQQADLQRVRGADLHAEGDVAVHGKGDGVEEFGGVGHEGEERDAEEFLVDVDAFEDHVDGVDEDLGDDGVEERCA